MIKTLSEAVSLSVSANESQEYDADFPVLVDGKHWNVYAVSISYRDILVYCNQGTATLLVDSYGDRHSCLLFDWEKE